MRFFRKGTKNLIAIKSSNKGEICYDKYTFMWKQKSV